MLLELDNNNNNGNRSQQRQLLEPLLRLDAAAAAATEVQPQDVSAASDTATSAAAANADTNNNKDIVIPNCCPFSLCCRKQNANATSSNQAPAILLRMNHNVLLNLLLNFLYGISDSLWAGTVLAAYLKKLGHEENEVVGNIEAVNGLAALLSALPVGYMADKFGRSLIIKVGGAAMLVTAVMHIALITWVGVDDEDTAANHDSYENVLWLTAGIMALWGIVYGVVNGPAQALYADSTPEGERSVYYSYLFISYLVASSVGPMVAIVLFQTVGDEWDLRHLRNVLYVGLSIGILNALVMFFFDDAKALDEKGPARFSATSGTEEVMAQQSTHDHCGEGATNGSLGAVVSTTETSTTTEIARTTTVKNDEAQLSTSLLTEATTTTTPSPPTSTATTTNVHSEDVDVVEHGGSSNQRYIPYIMFFHGLIMAVGSGMTVKFFPLFFKEDVHMSPSQVQGIYVTTPLAMALGSALATKAACYIGRIQVCIAFQTVGISLLLSMVLFRKHLDTHPFLLVPVYILRTALMNAVYPVEESVVMDFVPRHERARWKSLESVSAFGWCGSAALGGWLADTYDYSYTFSITAVVQVIGVLALIPLLSMVPRFEGGAQQQQQQQQHVASTDEQQPPVPTSNEDGEVLCEPLLTASSLTT